ncbi:Uncharacterized protein Rs2_16041 [Raphanus sativus]|nr:Uncharacterized protein Rs2_16041 [Raphanus sativus]
MFRSADLRFRLIQFWEARLTGDLTCQLMALANTNVDFPDVFGDVCGIKTTFNNENQAIHCLKVNRRCSFGVGFSCCYPWKAGTNLYFDNEYLAGQSVLAVLYGSDDGSSSTASKYVGVKKIEPVTLAELNNYVLNSPPHFG